MRLAQSFFNQDSGWVDLPSASEWDSQNTLVFAFCSPRFIDNPKPLQDLKKKFPLSTIVGCSTSGEIRGSQLTDLSIVVNFSQFTNAHFKIASAPIENPEHSRQVGESLAQNLKGPNLKGAIILSDGLKTNGSTLIDGFNCGLNFQQVPVGGGLAGDGNAFQRTFIVINNEIKPHYALAVGFYGDDLEIKATSRGGWDIFGPQRVITKSRGNVLYEIDERPILDLYKEYLGEKASELPASGLLFPLQISPPNNSDKKLVRTILSMNEEEKSLIFAGDVPEKWTAQLMCANFDRVIDGASLAYQQIQDATSPSDDPELVIAVSCVGRRLVLGERSSEELEAVTLEMDMRSKLIGFYSYGELAPLREGSPCELHNQSMTLFVIKEKFRAIQKKAS
jgi:hypothetical protein